MHWVNFSYFSIFKVFLAGNFATFLFFFLICSLFVCFFNRFLEYRKVTFTVFFFSSALLYYCSKIRCRKHTRTEKLHNFYFSRTEVYIGPLRFKCNPIILKWRLLNVRIKIEGLSDISTGCRKYCVSKLYYGCFIQKVKLNRRKKTILGAIEQPRF